ncbi:MAG: histidine kinase, partial [Oleibacter sp.]|nr:histidine kinase [Thalassolituus sp.]
TTKARGLGLGLALSRRIIETLGGSLTLKETAAGGTCFVLTLPVYRHGETA